MEEDHGENFDAGGEEDFKRASDFTNCFLEWLGTQFDLEEVTCAAAGIFIGVALAIRHPKYARRVYCEWTRDYKIRSVGSSLLFEAMGVAGGEERTAPQQLADELVEALPLEDEST